MTGQRVLTIAVSDIYHNPPPYPRLCFQSTPPERGSEAAGEDTRKIVFASAPSLATHVRVSCSSVLLLAVDTRGNSCCCREKLE